MLIITISQDDDGILIDSKFWDRIRSLDSQIMIYDSDYTVPGLKTSNSWQELVKENNSNQILWLDSSQIFFDTDIIEHGLNVLATKWDYFTQWEFANLPVGIGIRAFNTLHPKISRWHKGPAELLDYIHDNPHEFITHYDNEDYTSFDQSLLSSLYSADKKSLLIESHLPSFNLQEFLNLTTKDSKVNWKYKSNKTFPYCDERGLKSAYGFESPECADFPTYVMFEMANRCNAKCIHCPQGLESFRDSIDQTSKISEAAFKNFVDQCVGRKIDFVRITADGEPLLHGKLFELIKYSSERGVGPIGLTTNGSLLNEKKAIELIQSGLFMIDISLDARKRETYEIVRKGLDYDQVHDNIMRLIQLRDKMNSPLQIMVSMVKQDQNKHEVEEFQEYWGGLIDKVLIREMHTNVNQNGEFNPMDENYRWPCAHWFRLSLIHI